ncbi:MAG: DoxX family protein [Candidatus Zambryskibacteria bacterium]|nr:DoxX family protein [Candidatus Zambryskibacteria bacterium]
MTKEKLIDIAVFLLRVVAGYIFVQHGGFKLFNWFGGIPGITEIPTLMLIAGLVEIIGGTLILLGFFTRPVAFVSSGQMAVAYFIAHANQGFWYAPLINQGEPALLLCFIFLFFSAYGAGIWSIDALIGQRKSA